MGKGVVGGDEGREKGRNGRKGERGKEVLTSARGCVQTSSSAVRASRTRKRGGGGGVEGTIMSRSTETNTSKKFQGEGGSRGTTGGGR